MIHQQEIVLPKFSRGFHLISDIIMQSIGSYNDTGLLNIFVKHTSAGITLNENADPSVRVDFETVMNKMVPEDQAYYTHIFEGSDDMPAHVKTGLIGSSVTIPITEGRMNLGIWQGIYLCEFRNNGGKRKLVLTYYS